MLHLYENAFTGVDDLALRTPYSDRAGLWDAVTPNSEAIAGAPLVRDVWAIELDAASGPPPDVRMLEAHGFTIISSPRIHRTTVYHLIKEQP